MKSGTPAEEPLSLALICLSHAWGGLEIMVTKIAAAFREKGHQVVLVSPAGSQIQAEAGRQDIPHVPITPQIKYLDPKVIGDLARLFRRRGVRIAVATLSRDISAVVLAGRYSPETKLAYFQQMQFGHPKLDLIHRLTYGALDSWVTLTKTMKESVLRNTVVKEGMIDVIPIGTDTSAFDPKRFTRTRARRAFRLPGNSLLVGFIGRLDKQKGCEEFLQAAAIVRRSMPGATFVLAGEETRREPGYAGRLVDLGESLGLKNHTRFLPFTDQVPLFLASLDVLAIPSHSETYGYVAIEGMAMGIPVIGTNAGGLPEIIVDGETGILVPPKNPEELAFAMRTLLKQPRLRNVMGAKGRKRVKEWFDFQKSMRQLEQCFRKLS